MSDHTRSGDSGSWRFGVYVHWPYCAAICPYCDFNVYRDRGEDRSGLIAAVIADIQGWRERVGARQVESIFLGGGTPSRLEASAIAKILHAIDDAWGIVADAEISLEANPEDISPPLVEAMAAVGVTRLSLGMQALDDTALKSLGRWHTADDSRRAAETALSQFTNVSLDLIYAREGQSLSGWEVELRAAAGIGAHHLSLYQLTIEPGTPFANQVRRGSLCPPNDDQAADFYELTQSLCDELGYPSYEISNHARSKSAQSRHNRLYWECQEWAGVGPGAHGRYWRDGRRCATEAHRRPEAYCDAVGTSGWGVVNSEVLTTNQCAQEFLLMGLRLSEGVSLVRYGQIAPAPLCEQAIAQLSGAGLIVVNGDRLSVARHARALTERIAAELMSP